MEPDHPFVIARLVGVFLCALPAVRELYQYVNDPRCARLASCINIRGRLTIPFPSHRVGRTRGGVRYRRGRSLTYTRRAVRMGQHVWLLLATIGTELLAITKWGQGQFPAPLPTRVRWAWAGGALLLVLYPTVRVRHFFPPLPLAPSSPPPPHFTSPAPLGTAG